MAYLLGIDLGTSSIKCAVVDSASLKIIATASQEYPLLYPQAGHVEQHPQAWWQATIDAIQAVVKRSGVEDFAGIGFSGQMHGTVLVDKQGEVLHPAIIWADQRSKAVLRDLLASVGEAAYVTQTGTLPAAGFLSGTLLWIKQHRPELLEQVAHVMLPKDYVRFRMTGEIATDVSDAAGTGIFDIYKQDWAWKIVDAIGLPRHIFPKVVASYDITGELTNAAAEAFGIKSGIPIVAGCADQPAQAIGNGIIGVGRASITSGSGGQIFIPLTQLKTDARIHVFNHASSGCYALGAILSAGLALRWLRDWLDMSHIEDAYAILSQEAEQVAAGSDGLFFLPYLNGERTPHMNPNAQGAFIGLTSRHTRGHLARAVMEGVAFALKQAYEVCLSVTDTQVDSLVGAGGGINSPLWRQIIVDVLNQPIQLSTQTEQASLGAALLAGVGIGAFGATSRANFDYLADKLGNYSSVTDPSKNSDYYQERYQLFCELYPLLHAE